jgi:hypothetical protein
LNSRTVCKRLFRGSSALRTADRILNWSRNSLTCAPNCVTRRSRHCAHELTVKGGGGGHLVARFYRIDEYDALAGHHAQLYESVSAQDVTLTY